MVLAAIVGVLLVKAAEERLEHAAPAVRVGSPGGADLSTRGTVGLAPVAVYDYLEFAGLLGPEGKRTIAGANEYTARGLLLFADALAAVAAEHPGRVHTPVIADLRAFADQLHDRARASDHPRIVRHAFGEGADAIEALSPREGPRLRRLAAAVAPDEPLREQRDAIDGFFRQSADILGTVGELRGPIRRPEA
jgi:hypothetical protein